jgi:hypothetical protein
MELVYSDRVSIRSLGPPFASDGEPPVLAFPPLLAPPPVCPEPPAVEAVEPVEVVEPVAVLPPAEDPPDVPFALPPPGG